MIRENLAEVEEKICKACERAGRDRDEVTLIAVSKTKPISMIEEVLNAGIIEFGENKVQELTLKCEILPKKIHWHLIGHLQRNKVKYIIDQAYMIHSVDSLRLAQAISQEAVKKNVTASILIEVNVAMEESKYGVSIKEVLPLIEEVSKLPNLKINGLMTIAPFVENGEKNREIFKELKKLSVDIKTKNIDNVNMNVLSMGMTGDYEVAIEEGATHVRVGTGIFGERNYNID
ncbi:YggS family pyridoxal phosphate-dependent enzyme [Lachnotalea glycerini]|jgi:pyridoxal phosphate enzyme (YggS family)|uniref:Pyridoxal phosphate homeostasis protein n=1 Tax=Lachnotalea glycerini TaxID=1763509 RepID=A0A371JJH3_9FIRM|nr:YggS family pyridoxal phosphate-dependent enzyme [Lachnotalea glycerini]RDY32857.1 YggS family pyridoxal phosphate-dependent enzyme [Lachnotalea glycerini]